uniref:30S ribosomal protein S13 n=1 Tax=Hemiarma marina TaxID=1848298 RepID=A0A679EJR4_9CRYP|nr:30S ribosomal protein S13 [Hemiarma marina]
MARFFDVEIADGTKVYRGLQKILGVGPWEASCACQTLGIGEDIQIRQLTPEEWQSLSDWVGKHGLVEKERRAAVREAIGVQIRCGSYRGTRHSMGYPVRGQRTHTNASRRRALRRR